ncbi:MAG TPA: urease accessory protein UreD [Candidatus Obscuribacterales bacterium]
MPNIGIASLNVAVRAGRSVVTQQFGKAPLQVHKPLYLESADHPTVFLKTPSSGLLEGDEHRLRIKVERNATLEIRTQACTLVYPGASRQKIDIVLEDGASLIFEPHPLILARGAKFTQTIAIALAGDCHLLFSESWCAGRIAMNERWKFDSFENTVLIRSNQELIYREHWILHPKLGSVDHPFICGEFTHFKNSYTTGRHRAVHGTGGQEPALSWFLTKPNFSIKRTAASNVDLL